VGAKLEWKKAQKKEKKNITSETINNNIPIFKPFCTFCVCLPWKVDSIIISLNH